MTIDDETLGEIDPSLLLTPEQKAEIESLSKQELMEINGSLDELTETLDIHTMIENFTKVQEELSDNLDVLEIDPSATPQEPEYWIGVADTEGQFNYWGERGHLTIPNKEICNNLVSFANGQVIASPNFFVAPGSGIDFLLTAPEIDECKKIASLWQRLRQLHEVVIEKTISLICKDETNLAIASRRAEKAIGPEIPQAFIRFKHIFSTISLILQSRTLLIRDKIKDNSFEGKRKPREDFAPERNTYVVSDMFSYSEGDAEAAKQKYLSWIRLDEESKGESDGN